MMANTGRNKYVPKSVLEEIADIQKELNIGGDAEAMCRMADYSQIGREVERLTKLNFKHKPRKGRRLF